jgi:hypothetical protein
MIFSVLCSNRLLLFQFSSHVQNISFIRGGISIVALVSGEGFLLDFGYGMFLFRRALGIVRLVDWDLGISH